MLRIYLSMLFVLLSLSVYGQDPAPTQFTRQPLYLNPAYAGATRAQRLIMSHFTHNLNRASGTTNTTFLSYDLFFSNALGLGALFYNDFQSLKSGGGINSLSGSLLLSYEQPLNASFRLRGAVQAGFVQRKLSARNLVFGNDLTEGGTSGDPLIDQGGPVVFEDLSIGMLLGSESFSLGLAFHHLSEPEKYSLAGENFSRLRIKYGLHASKTFHLQKNKGPLIAEFQYQYQYPFEHFTFGAKKYIEMNFQSLAGYKNYQLVYLGGWIKSFDLPDTNFKFTKPDALSLGGGLIINREYSNLQFGINYDITLSQLSQRSTAGSLSFSISYSFKGGRNSKNFKPDEPVDLFNRKGRCQDYYLWSERQFNSLMLNPYSRQKK